MKILKKSLSMLLALTMIVSAIGISVFAAMDPDYVMSVKFRTDKGEVSSVKAGTTVKADIYVTAGNYYNMMLYFMPVEKIEKSAIELKLDGLKSTVAASGKITLECDPGEAFTVGTEPIATFTMTLPAGSTGSDVVMLAMSADDGTSGTASIGDAATPKAFDFTVADAKLGITPSFTANAAKAVKDGADVSKVEVGLDTAKETALAGITATVTDGANNEPGYEITWGESTPAYNAKQTGDYVFKGSVAINGEGAANAGTLTDAITVTVTVGKIALDEEGVVVDSITAKTYQKAADDATVKSISAADVATAVNNEHKTVGVKKGEYTGIANISWAATAGAADLDLTKVTDEEGNSANIVTLTGTLTAPADSEFFKDGATAKTVTMVVKVVPAEISGGAISINNPIDNGYVTANITVPADVVAKMPTGDTEEDVAKRTISLIVPNADPNKEGATVSVEVTPEQIAAAKEADAKDLNVTLKSDKKMKDLGYSSSGANKNFTVTVTVGGTQLVQKDKDGKVVPVSGEVKKATTGNAGGIHKGGSTTTTYAVTVVETKNGTATVSPEKAASGATVTVKPEPAEGYKVKSVTAVKADGTNVPVDEKAYTFTMPASAVKVTVEFEEGKNEPSVDPTPAEDKFADVADDFWAAKDIYTLKDAGIIGGKSATEFDPEGDVTRAEFAKMVVGLFGYKATSDAVNFEDCKAEDWFTPYVAAGVEAGVIKGVSDTEFAPNATITREDACTILGRALNKVAQSNELKFTDADKVAEYAAPYVALLSELGYVNGYEDGSFAPTNNITRAEAAKIIAGIYNAKDSTEDKADNTDTIDVAPEK